jgi:hypothetical protein
MGKHRNILKALRATVLEHAVERPDLALMARDLGRMVHQDAAALAAALTPLRQARQGPVRWILATRNKPPISVLVMAWPANHATPVHQHPGPWGLTMALVGALEVQPYGRDGSTGDLLQLDRTWLGPGDGIWFETEGGQTHRCRNLSRHETALSLHVHGGNLAECAACGQAEPAGTWMPPAQRSATTGHLPG